MDEAATDVTQQALQVEADKESVRIAALEAELTDLQAQGEPA